MSILESRQRRFSSHTITIQPSSAFVDMKSEKLDASSVLKPDIENQIIHCTFLDPIDEFIKYDYTVSTLLKIYHQLLQIVTTFTSSKNDNTTTTTTNNNDNHNDNPALNPQSSEHDKPKGPTKAKTEKKVSTTTTKTGSIKTEKNYFLMKSEPHVFSIDDLRNLPNSTDHWDGVRNHVAKNIMKNQMKIGDLAFFYHSNAKKKEDVGIIGVVKIVALAEPDPTQFDSKSEYYDPKSTRENPRWWCVQVQYDEKFNKTLGLQEMKQLREEDNDGNGVKILKDMQLFNNSRLSVQNVSAEQWHYLYEKCTKPL